jgi:ABC-2 type transport system permease protein
MNKFLSLLKLQVNAQFGLSYFKYSVKNDKKTLFKAIGIGFVILIALAEVIGIYAYLLFQIHKGMATINSSQVILTISAVVSGIVVLVFGIFNILSTLFLAKDTEFLAALPIRQESVFMSKFVLILLSEYPLAFLLMLPAVIIYGIGAQKGVLYYFLSVVCTLFLPLIPLVISAALSLLLMGIVSRTRRRDLITIVGSIVLMILFFGGQNYLMSRIPEDKQEFLMTLISSTSAIVAFVGRLFPPSVWITKVLTTTGMEALINLAYLILCSLAALILVYFLASLIYQRGATAQLETMSKPGKSRLKYKASSHVMTIFKNEWRIILRTPIYALNSLVMIIIAPILMIIPMFGGSLANDPDIKFLFDLIEKSESQPSLLLILAGIISFFVLINPAVSSSISREGKNFWILKNIPVKPKLQIYGKLFAGCSISVIAAVLTSMAAMISFGIRWDITVMIAILCILALIPVSAVNLYIDLKRPKLTWSNPQEAIKQNMNVVLGMLAGFLIISVFGALGYVLILLNLNVYALFCLMAVIIIAAAFVCMRLLIRAADESYKKLAV